MGKWLVAAVAAVLCVGILRGQGKISFEDGEGWGVELGQGGGHWQEEAPLCHG